MDVFWQSGKLVSLGLGGAVADRYGIEVVSYFVGARLVGTAAYGLVSTSNGPSGRTFGGAEPS